MQLENIEVCPDDLILFRISDNLVDSLGNLELVTRSPGAVILTFLSFFSLPYSEVLYTLTILMATVLQKSYLLNLFEVY